MTAKPGEAEAFAHSVAPMIAEAKASGAKSLREIAAVLNYRGIKTRDGNKWQPQTVKNAILFSGSASEPLLSIEKIPYTASTPDWFMCQKCHRASKEDQYCPWCKTSGEMKEIDA